jgi:uncharacterized protein YegP (UPF0339 family)
VANGYFTVWRERKKSTWRYTLWSCNGRPLMESNTSYTSKASARRGCVAASYCFAGDTKPEILDGISQ